MAFDRSKIGEDEVNLNRFSNITVNILSITEDRLENILNKNINKIRKPKDIVAAIALCLSLYGLAFVSDINDLFGIPGEFVKGSFMFMFVISCLYLLYVLYNYFFNRVTAEKIIKEIKEKKQ